MEHLQAALITRVQAEGEPSSRRGLDPNLPQVGKLQVEKSEIYYYLLFHNLL
jgi:hypothetical protein